MAWTSNVPTSTNQIGTDIDYIRNNFSYLYDLLTVQEIWVGAERFVAATTSAAADGSMDSSVNYLKFRYFAFDKATEEWAGFNIVMPSNWNRGTVKAKFYWAADTGAVEGEKVEWAIAGIAISDGDNVDSELGTEQVISDINLGNAGQSMQSSASTAAITIGGTPALGDIINFRISRNVGSTEDNLDSDARLFGVMLQITVTNSVTSW